MSLEYIVIEEFTLDKIILVVNDHIKKGWIPLGGICKMGDDLQHSVFYLQSMTKEDKNYHSNILQVLIIIQG